MPSIILDSMPLISSRVQQQDKFNMLQRQSLFLSELLDTQSIDVEEEEKPAPALGPFKLFNAIFKLMLNPFNQYMV